MTFASSVRKRQNYDGVHAITYKFTGASGDTGGDIAHPFSEILEAQGYGYKDDKSAKVAVDVFPSSGSGYVVVEYTDPTADHTGYVTLKGLF